MSYSKEILTQEEKLNLINFTLDDIIQKESRGNFFSRNFNVFKNVWNKHKYSRLATGIALSSGVVLATASGALAVAGIMIATRSALSAIGGFVATDAIFDIINEKATKDAFEKLLIKAKNVSNKNDLEKLIQEALEDVKNSSKDEIIKKIEETQKKIQKKGLLKRILSTTVGIGLGILGGSKVLEITGTQGVKGLITGTQSQVSSVLSSNDISMNKSVDSNLIKNVFDDIKNDHPKQGYSTIEQSVRRLEGLRNGIGLNESFKLNQFNSSIAEDIRKPGSNIIESAKNLGYLKDGQNFDEIAKKLTQDKIEKILIKAYESNPLIGSKIGNPNLEKVITIASNNIENINESPLTTGNRIKNIGIGIALGLGSLFLGKKISSPKKFKKNNSKTKLISNNTNIDFIGNKRGNKKGNVLIQNNYYNDYEEEENQVVKNEKPVEIKVESKIPGQEITNLDSSEEKNLKLQKRINIVTIMLNKILGFKYENCGKRQVENICIFSKKTVGGAFSCIYGDDGNKVNIEISWYDHGIKKSSFKGKFEIDNNFDENNFAKTIESYTKEILKKIFIRRDQVKNMELAKYLHTVEITNHDLALIYKHLEHPEVIRNGSETIGFWFQNIYSFSDGILRFENLCNPKYEEMYVDQVNSWIKAECYAEYSGKNNIKTLNKQFDKYERTFIENMIVENILSPNRIAQNILPGAIMDFNWHKHPGNLNHPSGGDLLSSSTVGRIIENPNVMTCTWGIVNVLPRDINDNNKPNNSIIIRGRDFFGERNYIIYFWKINRDKNNVYLQKNLIPINAKKI